MSQTERLYKIEQLLRSKRSVPIGEFLRALEVSRPTFRRDLDLLRDRLNAPIVYDYHLRGYRFGDTETGAARHELPGLWFSSSEIHALLTFYHFLESLEPGLLTPHIEPLKDRIKVLLESKDQAMSEITQRVRILPQLARRTEAARFQLVAHALLERKRLHLHYHGRTRDDITERTVSPQRLVHYRDNWYLDAWCHRIKGLRTFAVERIREPAILDQPAKNVADDRLHRHFASSYGIFAGRPKHKAALRFSPERARWVAEERWHPEQKGYYRGNDYFLEIPYSDDRELILDILRYGPEVKVVSPKSLQDKVLERLLKAAAQYQS